MPERLYRDPLTPPQRAELEGDLISFCDRQLDLLGDLRGLDVLYAGGASPLWLEGLGQRIGSSGTLTALDADEERVAAAREVLPEADLAAPVRLVAGDVFGPPFGPGTFDLVYSAGLLHELDVRERPAQAALAALARTVRPGGRVTTEDFVDSAPALQIEDERIQGELARAASGAEPFGIGPPGRLISAHESVLVGVRWRLLPPFGVRHLDRLVLAEEEPAALLRLPDERRRDLRARWAALRESVRREGYTRPATLYVEGTVVSGASRRA
jgi:SAM-dependent methyltransferase